MLPDCYWFHFPSFLRRCFLNGLEDIEVVISWFIYHCCQVCDMCLFQVYSVPFSRGGYNLVFFCAVVLSYTAVIYFRQSQQYFLFLVHRINYVSDTTWYALKCQSLGHIFSQPFPLNFNIYLFVQIEGSNVLVYHGYLGFQVFKVFPEVIICGCHVDYFFCISNLDNSSPIGVPCTVYFRNSSTIIRCATSVMEFQIQ